MTDEILKRLDALEAKLDGRFDHLEGRFDDLEAKVDELQGELEGHRELMTDNVSTIIDTLHTMHATSGGGPTRVAR